MSDLELRVVGCLAALVAAGLFGVGTVVQQEVAVADARAHDGLGIRRLLRDRSWLLAQGATIGAALLQVLALALAPVALVQPLLASGLVLALALRLVRESRGPRALELAGAAATVVGLVVFLVAAAPGQSGHVRAGTASVVVATVTCAVLLLASVRLPPGVVGALLCGVVGGVCLSAAAVLVASGLDGVRTEGLPSLVGVTAPAAVAASVLGEVACQQAFSRGALAWSLPALTVVDPLLSVAAARLVLHEQLRAGSAALWLPAAAVAAAGVVLLAAGTPAQPEPAEALP